MLAQDLMTTTLVTVAADTPLAAIAQLFADRGISGVPVVDEEGRLLGLVTEGDLLRRLAAGADQPAPWLYKALASKAARAGLYAKTHGRHASDVMTTKLATVTETTPIEAVAKLIEDRRLRRVPVLRDDRLVGLISRADLIRALLVPPSAPSDGVPDEQIRRELTLAIRRQTWVDSFYIFPVVEHAVVTFHGFVGSDGYTAALRALAESVPGVKEVRFETQATPRFLFGVP